MNARPPPFWFAPRSVISSQCSATSSWHLADAPAVDRGPV